MKEESAEAKAAKELFAQNYNCAQSILTVFGPDLGVSRKTAMAIGAGLGGGIGGQAEVCGAVTGAVAILGLAYGRHSDGNPDKRSEVAKQAQKFIEKFKESCGSIKCRELLPVDISTKDGILKAKDEKIFMKECPKFIEAAAELLAEMTKLPKE